MSLFDDYIFSISKPNQSKTKKRKNKRKNDILWTFEEEYLFFEAHSILGNRWTHYNDLFLNNKTPKELKNHFHTCIIKLVRKIINKKYDKNLKDIMRNFYVFQYLTDLILKTNQDDFPTKEKKKKIRYKFNPKLLINKEELSIKTIDNYAETLRADVLFTNPGILNFLEERHFSIDDFPISKIPLLFELIIKKKILTECQMVLNDKTKSGDNNSINTLVEFVFSNVNNSELANKPLTYNIIRKD